MKPLALLALLAACKEAPPLSQPPLVAPIIAAHPQGITGHARFMEGDFMPHAEGEESSGTSGWANGRLVHLYRGEHAVVMKVDPTDPAYVASTVVLFDGSYAFPLAAAGKYTPVIETRFGKPFNKCTMKETESSPGVWCPIEVVLGQWNDKELVEDENTTW